MLVLLLIQLSILFHLSESSIAHNLAPTQQNSSSKGRHQQAPLVQSTCNSTSFYDLCITAIADDPSSTTADVPGLCAIAVSAAAANASGTASFLLRNASDGGAATPEADRALLRTCAGKYAAARDALVAARASLAEQDYDYAFVHVSAAAEYPAVCRTLFRRRQRPGRATYPAELAKREEALRRLCTISLDIISLLQTQE
jgi:pectinesterase inhibitor-like protein